jgi:uncharacterized protein YndB with AHSA1/START domain
VSSGAVAVVQRTLPAPPGVVFDEWLDADGMKEWMCPRPAVPTRIEIEPRVGGRFHLEIEDEGVGLTVTGTYLAIERPSRLQFTWHCSVWEPATPASIVTVLLEPHGEGETLMTIHHAHLRPDLIDGHQHGWVAIADQLCDQLDAGMPH